MTTLNKIEAAKALCISPRTLASRMKSGAVQFTKVEGARIGEQSVSFTYADLHLPEPSAAPAPVVHDVQIAPQYDDPPAPARPVNSIEQKADEDASFAERYLAGEATDSMGNSITGNSRWPNKGKVTALGPVEPQYNPPPDTTAHMDPALIGNAPMIGVDGEPVIHGGSDNHPLNCEATYEAFRKPGQPSYAELHSIRAKLPHPNATRNEYFKNIFRDIRLGWSR